MSFKDASEDSIRLFEVQTTVDQTHTLVDKLKMSQTVDFGIVVCKVSHLVDEVHVQAVEAVAPPSPLVSYPAI